MEDKNLMSIYRYAEDNEKNDEPNPIEKGTVTSVDEEGNISQEEYTPPETHDESIDALPEYETPQIDREQAQSDSSDYSNKFDSKKGGENNR
jgi:hypothetical protein